MRTRARQPSRSTRSGRFLMGSRVASSGDIARISSLVLRMLGHASLLSNDIEVSMSRTVEIVEVGPRDGLQSVPGVFPTEDKIRLIEQLIEACLRRLDTTS